MVEKAGSRQPRAPKGYVQATYETLTSPDNAAMVRAIAAFGVCATITLSTCSLRIATSYSRIMFHVTC